MSHHNSTRKIECKFCSYRCTRDDMVKHIELKHSELIPVGWETEQLVFDWINGTNGHGTCMVCHGPTKWNIKTGKYFKHCGNPKCVETLSSKAKGNMIRVRGVPHLLNDSEQQIKMLNNRSISGSYTFSDKTTHSYTGKNEKQLLEFMDKVLEIPGSDIVSPGPVLEYKYNGKIHKYITDFLYIPYNLIIEVKDGGNNPNKRPMEEYRNKQVAKEDMITNLGIYHYLKLTDNQFDQLLRIFAEIRSNMIDYNETDPKKIEAIIHLNESGRIPLGMPPQNNSMDVYIVNYPMKNLFISNGFDGIAFSYHPFTDKYITSIDNKVNMILLNDDIKRNSEFFKFNCKKSNFKKLLKSIGNEMNIEEIYKLLTSNDLLVENQFRYDSKFEKYAYESFLETSIFLKTKKQIFCEFNYLCLDKDMFFPIINRHELDLKSMLESQYPNIDFKQDSYGYFGVNKESLERTSSYTSLSYIPDIELISLSKLEE